MLFPQRGDARLLIITMDMIESICEKTIKNRGKNTSECPRKPGGKVSVLLVLNKHKYKYV